MIFSSVWHCVGQACDLDPPDEPGCFLSRLALGTQSADQFTTRAQNTERWIVKWIGLCGRMDTGARDDLECYRPSSRKNVAPCHSGGGWSNSRALRWEIGPGPLRLVHWSPRFGPATNEDEGRLSIRHPGQPTKREKSKNPSSPHCPSAESAGRTDDAASITQLGMEIPIMRHAASATGIGFRRPAGRRAYRCRPAVSVERVSQPGDDRTPRREPCARFFSSPRLFFCAPPPFFFFSCDCFARRSASAGKRSARRDGRAHDEIPRCTSFVDAAAPVAATERRRAAQDDRRGGRRRKPGAVICVAEGTYAEQLTPGEKSFTLAGGFQRGKDFKVRDSAAYVSRATGRGGSFIRIEDPGPKGNQLTAIDGFDISGYSQAIFRDYYESQRFDITNNHIHDNRARTTSSPAAASRSTTSRAGSKATSSGTTPAAAGGAGFLNDTQQRTRVTIERNLIDGNAGTSRTRRTAAASISSARRSGSPPTCSRATP